MLIVLMCLRTGLGTVLMKLLESIGEKIPDTHKTMLTCFVSNERGVRFYERLGYEKDEFSPPPKVLRNGTKVEADYVILSKAIQR
jgi:RimJ/RimL family protein N-acetyltransferase